MKIQKIIYWIATVIMTLVFSFSAYMYIFNNEAIQVAYKALGFPTWMIYPSAILKIIAIIVILTDFNKVVKEWAYAGLFITAAFALAAHQIAQDGQAMFAIIACVAILISRAFYQYRKLRTA